MPAAGKKNLSPSKRKEMEQGTLDGHVTRPGRTRGGSRKLDMQPAPARRGLAGTPAAHKAAPTKAAAGGASTSLQSTAPGAAAAVRARHRTAEQRQQASKPPAAAKPAPAPPTKKGRARAAPGAAAGPRRRCPLASVSLEDETFSVGDTVYVVLDEGVQLGEEEEARCVACGSEEKEEVAMLECSRCLGGWHLTCLDPPLADVPEGDWLCPDCSAGKPPRPRAANTAHEKFLQQQGLGLARIEALWEEAGGEQQCLLRWYNLPEETHTGRQAHHAAREVFLTQLRTEEEVGVLLLYRGVHVLPPRDFFRGGDTLGGDVFLCEYEYDTAWQRFRRRTLVESDDEGEEDGEDWCPSEDDAPEEERRDKTFKPIDAYWAEKGAAAAKSGRPAGRKKTQGGSHFLEQVGALAIPDHLAARRRPGGHSHSGLAAARDALTLTSVPPSLPCRERERREVAQFVQDVLDDADQTGCGKCLYVSGIPGTGKTATVLEVMRDFKRRAERNLVPHFQFVEINGLRVPSPAHALSALYEALTGDRVGPQAASQLLDEMMSGGGGGAGTKGGSSSSSARRHTIVLVDEMDMLVNKTQTVLYNLFDWPGRKGSRLSIIGVANTMDLPERLHPRIGSRLGGRRVVFQPYNTNQLQEIVRSRLEGLEAFEPSAVTLVARKVANCSGDVRRCLELCRRAAEIAETRWRQQQKERAAQAQPSSDSSSEAAAESSGSAPAPASQQQQQQGGVAGAGTGPSGQPVREESGKVEMRHVNAAVQEMFNTSHVVMIRTASRLERLLLAALHLEVRHSGRAEALLEDVADRLNVLCQNNMEPQRYQFGAVLEAAVRLGSKRLILCDPGFKRLKAKVSLNVPTNDLLHVLRSDQQIRWLEARLTS